MRQISAIYLHLLKRNLLQNAAYMAKRSFPMYNLDLQLFHKFLPKKTLLYIKYPIAIHAHIFALQTSLYPNHRVHLKHDMLPQ